MHGGSGNDLYWVDSADDGVIEYAGEGNDTVESSISYTLRANVENLTLTETAWINGTGNGLANTITGNGGSNVLNGGAGADRMSGGAGDDTYVVDNAGDRAIRATTAGSTDLVKSLVSFTLGARVENLTLTGTSATNGTGNGSANVIIGNGAGNILSGLAGRDSLSGAGGADTLNGGAGSDTLNGGAGSDMFRFDTALSALNNVDTIVGFSVINDTMQLDDDIFTAAGGVGTLTASAFRVGTSAADADDRIIYDRDTGKIYYDADGNGSGGQVLFAYVTAGLTLSNADFQIIG